MASLGAVTSNGVGGTHVVPMKYRAAFAVAPGPVLTCTNPPPGGRPRIASTYEGIGNGTHLGIATITIVFESCAFVGAGGVLLSVPGHAVITAANGDELYSTFTMKLHPGYTFDFDPLEFGGGTGRYANAVGNGTGSGFIDNSAHAGQFELVGLITRPNN